MAGLRRLDAELVRRKMVRSREQAQEWIKAGRVYVNGMQAAKPATQVAPDASIRVADGGDEWASRGAYKLLGALDAFAGWASRADVGVSPALRAAAAVGGEGVGLAAGVSGAGQGAERGAAAAEGAGQAAEQGAAAAKDAGQAAEATLAGGAVITPDLKDKRILDAGASTGGFTDVCLRRGAREVVAVDVGYGQLIWRLQNDPRVKVFDRTNVRHLTPELIGGPCDVMVGDLSFISLTLVLPAIVQCMAPGAQLFPMIKPQFEVGKDRLGHGGVVRQPALREETTLHIAQFAHTLGLSTRAVTASPLPGPSGNVEYFLWLLNDGGITHPDSDTLHAMVHTAVTEGPQ